MNGTQVLIPYAHIEEGCRGHLRVKGEVLSTHHWWDHPEISWAHQINGHLPHMLVHFLIVHGRWVYGGLIFKEINQRRASVNVGLFHYYLFVTMMQIVFVSSNLNSLSLLILGILCVHHDQTDNKGDPPDRI